MENHDNNHDDDDESLPLAQCVLLLGLGMI
jgi:hypothetical protein